MKCIVFEKSIIVLVAYGKFHNKKNSRNNVLARFSIANCPLPPLAARAARSRGGVRGRRWRRCRLRRTRCARARRSFDSKRSARLSALFLILFGFEVRGGDSGSGGVGVRVCSACVRVPSSNVAIRGTPVKSLEPSAERRADLTHAESSEQRARLWITVKRPH
jgi:hypothetical protein